MRILTVLTYYRPHTSGLTIYAERLARALVRRGHEVTVLTSQFEKDLPLDEVQDGVHIKRVPVLFRISKGVIMPSIGVRSWQEVSAHDALLLHLPQFDAAGIAIRGRLLKKPTILIYHSDLTLPDGIFNRVVNMVVHLMNEIAARFSHRISAYTEDFATHSPYLSRFPDKVAVNAPAVEIPKPSRKEVAEFKSQHNSENRSPVIGMATRLAAEKGVEYLIRALPRIFEEFPNAKVLYAGQFEDVLGEEAYFESLRPLIEKYQAAGQWTFLGVLDMQQMAAFYNNIDVIVVPSTNSTETFGFVQIEAMMNGTPSVASNLPGVRQPIIISGMGRVTPIGDADALAKNIVVVLKNPADYSGDVDKLRIDFSPETNAERHEALFLQIAKDLGKNIENS
jgi:glycosyltransferase involved in cell wall biosynthesis